MRPGVTAACVLVVLGLAQVARANDSPTGTWSFPRIANGQPRGMTLKLNLDGDKLTGAVFDGKTETAIEEASFKDGLVSFKATLNINGKKIGIKQVGKLDKDVIKGKIEVNKNGTVESGDFAIYRKP